MAVTKVQSEFIVNDVALAGNPTTSTQSSGNNTTRIATTAFVTAAIDSLIDSAPGTLNTLDEIAAALNDDPSFTTTVNNAIATKLPLAGGTMTGSLTGTTATFTTADNLDTLSLLSTDTDDNSGPNLNMYRNSSSPADNDVIGQVKFTGRNDNTQDVVYASISGKIIDASDSSEDGNLRFWTIAGGTNTETLTLSSGKVGIGEPNPAYPLAIQADGIVLRLDGTANTTRSIFFRNTTTANPAQLYSDGSLRIYTEDSSTDITLDAVQNIILDADDGGHVRFKDAGTQYASIYKSGSDAILDSTGDITLDATDRIVLSADDNGEIRLQDGASLYGQFKDDDDRLSIQGLIEDKDMLFVINDGTVLKTALTLNAASGGNATFAGNVTANNLYVADDIVHSGDTNTYISLENDNQTYYAGGTRLMDLKVGDIIFNEGGGGVDFRVESGDDSNSFSMDGTTGNIGIGLAPTLARFNLLYDVANWTAIFKNTASNAYGLSIDLSQASSAGGQANIFALACYTPGTDKGFFVTKSGNAAIGTVQPVSTSIGYDTATLHLHNAGSSSVGAQLRLTADNAAIGNGFYLSYWGDTNAYFVLQENSTMKFYMDDTSAYGWSKDNFYPQVDDQKDIGLSNYRFDDIYATNGTIQTSDETLKRDIAALTEAEKSVALKLKALMRTFRYKSSYEKKGDDARYHTGVVAQQVKTLFDAEELDISKYAFWIKGVYWVDSAGKELVDSEGDPVIPGTDAFNAIGDKKEAYTYGIRYEELLCFIIGAM